MSDHAERLRHMAEGWLRAAEDVEKYRTTREEKINSGRYYRAQAAALLAGAEALERYDEAKGVLRQIASGQSWNPQRDAEEALARLEGK